MARSSDWDVIVIWSGMGGMAAACALSRTGHKVLLLEQYHVLGGLTHSFSRQGFTWDAGIHYLSWLAPETKEHASLKWLSKSPIEFAPVGDVFDVLHLGDAEPLPVASPYAAHAADLKERFPDEAQAIDAWFEAVHRARDAAHVIFQSRSLQQPIEDVLNGENGEDVRKWCGRTTQDVADEITANAALKAAFLAQWGTLGGRPHLASFAIHATVACSYLESGAWYPVGGASAIADHMLPVIAAAGGEARANTRVQTLLMEDGGVVGVKTAEGEDIFAKAVISNIGAFETVNQLLPDGFEESAWVKEIRSFQPSICHFSLFLGFEGDIEAAGATKANHWLYPGHGVDVVWDDAPNGTPPAMFVSFATLKDPSYDPGPKQRHSGEMMILTDWAAVEKWADLLPGQRGEGYAALKSQVEEKAFAQFEAYFPQLAELVVFKEVATPFSVVSTTRHRKGAFYGVEATPRRFLSDALRMKTPIEGLYLSGQDVASPGIPGAMWGGLLCAANIEPEIFSHVLQG
jgi:all-trans-retinol 13,14-reductase